MTRERAGRPGVNWESVLRTTGEVLVECEQDDTCSPFGWNDPEPPRANRAARRAAARSGARASQESRATLPGAPGPAGGTR